MNEWVKTFKALSDETRLEIISMLYKYGFCVGALARQLNISEAAVSQHLKVLKGAGLVTGEKRGVYTYYRLNSEQLRSTAARISEFAARRKRYECCQHITGEHQFCLIYGRKEQDERGGPV